MKTYGGVEVQLHAFLTSALDADQQSVSRYGGLTPWETASGTNWIGRWVGPRAGLDAEVKWRNPCPCRESNPARPAPSLVTILTELTRLLHIPARQSVRQVTSPNDGLVRKSFKRTAGLLLCYFNTHSQRLSRGHADSQSISQSEISQHILQSCTAVLVASNFTHHSLQRKCVHFNVHESTLQTDSPPADGPAQLYRKDGTS
jgi:hypothetical protein